MSETNDHGPANHHPAFGISSQWIERVSIQSNICLGIRAGCMRMVMPGSMMCSARIKPRKWPAWPISGANLSMCLPRRVPPSPRRPSNGSHNCMAWRKRFGANHQKPALPCGRTRPNPSSMIWRSGFRLSFPKYPANRLWQRPFDMP